MRRRVARLAAALVITASVTACGGGGGGRGSSSSGHLTVLAAASLTESFGDIAGVLRSSARPLAPTLSFAGSQQLVAQVQAGAPADVIATADEASMQKLVDAHLVDQPVVFARNHLTIAVAAGNPKHIGGLADLGRPELAVVLADPSVPAGKYAAEALRRAGVTVRPRSLELDVKSALAKVVSGDADAAIVYATDVQSAGSKVAAVAIPAEVNPVAAYPVAVVRRSRNHAAAAGFISVLTGPLGRRILGGDGFDLP